jgi:acetamidase/formamidase
MRHNFKPSRYFYTFGPNEPSHHIKPGDEIVAPTVDAGGHDQAGNPIPDEMKHRIPGTELRQSNPLTGPFYIDGAEPGDALAITIQKISLNRPSAYSRIGPHFGCLTEEVPGRWFLLNSPFETIYYDWRLDLERNTGTLELHGSRLANVEIPLHPFLGSIGVAPRFGRVEMSLTPGEYGGNMDCVETKAGSTLYLPVFFRGGYLAFGDVHAAQGDGEICGVALETTAEVTMKVDLVIGKPIEWPRIEDDNWIMTACSSRPLMEAYKIAHYEMVKWLESEHGFERWEALQLLSQVGRCRIGNVVDPCYTVVAKFPRKYLPSR